MSANEVAALRSKFIAASPATDDDQEAPSNSRLVCRACGESVSNSTTRMVSHLNSSCKAVNNCITPGNGFLQRRQENESGSLSGSIVSSAAALTSTSTSVPSQQTNITNFISRIQWSRTGLEQVEFLFGKAVILSGLPFSVFDNEHFHHAFAALPFNFHPASRHYLSDQILPRLCEQIQCDVLSEVVQSTAVVLSTDGWSDRKHQSIHNLMVCTPIPYYYSRHKQDTEKADADVIYSIFAEGRKAISMEFESAGQAVPFLWAYLCDSTNVMRAARLKVPDVVGYGCPSHSLNNLCKDFAKNPVIADLLRIVSNLHKFFRVSHRPLVFLQKCIVTHLGKTTSLLSLGETRFGSIFTLFKSCLLAKPAFVEYCTYRLKDDTFDCDLPPGLLSYVQSRQF